MIGMKILSLRGEVYLYKLNKSDEKTPWMRPINNQTFQQYSRNLLLDNFLLMPILG